MINSKIELVADDAPIIAEDDTGATYDYGREGFSTQKPDLRAADWLAVRPKPEVE